MDAWERTSIRHDRDGSTYQINASFSSALLDTIYRSFDDQEAAPAVPVIATSYKGTMALQKHTPHPIKLHTTPKADSDKKQLMTTNYRRPENLVKKKPSKRFSYYQRLVHPILSSRRSSSSFSESSSAGFSSSERESVRGARTRPPLLPTASRPKPLRTRLPTSRPSPLRDEKVRKSKSRTTIQAIPRAADQVEKNKPVSPGARLTGFLSSLTKKAKLSSSSVDGVDSRSMRQPKNTPTSLTCSSASSYSRKSCLSTGSSSASSRPGRSVDGVKRSVRFYPVTVIVDEDCQPCGQKYLYEEDLKALIDGGRRSSGRPTPSEFIIHESAGNEILSQYQKKIGFMLRDFHRNEDEEDDDVASDSSSDLFELENLARMEVDHLREELPVYETTDLDTNRAIAKGLLL